MSQHAMQTCPDCHQSVSTRSRYCPYCGASMGEGYEPDDIVISGGKRLRVSRDTINLRSLLAMVESSVAWWKQRLQSDNAVNRERAAAAIQELSRILDSLAAQLALGRETVRITSRLPSTRLYTMSCPACGRGNRSSARFCVSCGAVFHEASATSAATKPLQALRLDSAALSDTGKVREHNEDTCYVGTVTASSGPPVTLLLVADGMGGVQAGEVASQLVSSTVRAALVAQLETQRPTSDEDWQQVLRRVTTEANQRVYEAASANPGYQGMGTTLTLVVVAAQRAHLAHAGDSRAYLFNTNGVTEDGLTWMQLTSDHSLVARLVDIGHLTATEARTHPHRNVIYRALGTHPSLEVDTSSQPLEAGDWLLLCTDGLTTHIEDEALALMVLASQNLRRLCQELIAQANQAGGHDNISVVVARVEERAHG